MICSFYLHIAIIITIITFNTWWNKNWWETVIEVIPNFLGFTLGGFAIFISFSNEKFLYILNQKDNYNDKDEIPYYISLCATFVHFIVVQTISFLYAIIVKSLQFEIPIDLSLEFNNFICYANKISGFIGYFLFIYGILAMIAATMHVLRIAYMFSAFSQTMQKKDQDKKSPSNDKKYNQ